MTTEPKYPLSVMRGYKPPQVRYTWTVFTKANTVHTGATHGGITNLINRGKHEIAKLYVTDLVRGKVYDIREIEEFMKLWGDNYMDYNWKVPQALRRQ